MNEQLLPFDGNKSRKNLVIQIPYNQGSERLVALFPVYCLEVFKEARKAMVSFPTVTPQVQDKPQWAQHCLNWSQLFYIQEGEPEDGS